MIKLFTAPWCSACTALKSNLNEEDLENLVIVDVDLEPQEAINYSIKSIPTLIKEVDGEEVDRKSGNMSRSDFLSFCE